MPIKLVPILTQVFLGTALLKCETDRALKTNIYENEALNIVIEKLHVCPNVCSISESDEMVANSKCCSDGVVGPLWTNPNNVPMCLTVSHSRFCSHLSTGDKLAVLQI